MPTYKNVSSQPIDWVTTGHMEPGEVKSLADEINHPDLKQVDDNEAPVLQGIEPKTDEAPTETAPTAPPPAAPTPPPTPTTPAPAAPAQPKVDDAPAPTPNVNEQGA